MTIAPTSNEHNIDSCILWQYENGRYIKNWVFGVAELGYKSCGKVFDDICDGIINLHTSDVTAIATYVVQSLAGAIGIDWGTVSNIPAMVDAIFSTRFFGRGMASEFLKIASVFGFTFSADQLVNGGLVRISIDGGNDLKHYEGLGAPVPMSVFEKHNEATRPCLLFSGDAEYDKDVNPRICSDAEMSFPLIGISDNWAVVDVIDGSIWTKLNGEEE